MRPPVEGDPLISEEFDEIMEVVAERLKNFPEEPPIVAMWAVLSNIGDRFAPVECDGGEWSGLKQDIPKSGNGEAPKCPDGHSINQGRRLSLGWIEDKGIQKKHGI